MNTSVLPDDRRTRLYVRVTKDEFARVTALAALEQCTRPNLLRRALSQLLMANQEEPLEERHWGRQKNEATE